MIPEIEVLQVQFLVKFAVALWGDLLRELGSAVSNLGADIVAESQNAQAMAELTTGIFGTDSGLLYWLNDLMFDIVTRLPYCDIGIGALSLQGGLMN